MKTPTATVLSVGAVLIAGGVALAINTSIFSGTTALASEEALLADTVKPPKIESEMNTNAAMTNRTASGTTPSTAIAMIPSVAEVPSLPDNAETVVFDVPNVGEVTVSRTDDKLSVTSARSSFGYSVMVVGRSGHLVEVEFEGSSAHFVFRAKVVAGSIITDVSSHDFPRPGGNGTMPQSTKRYNDDDDDDDDEYEGDHDDDDEGDHDDD